MPTVAITVDCEAAHENRHCYTEELIEVAEEFVIPITWFVTVSAQDPMSNANLYHREYMHRVPNWHEIGMKVNFVDDKGYVEDPTRRADMILMAKNILKSQMVKPTSFRAGSFAIIPPDLRILEDIGILVDSSVVPDANYKMFVDWAGAPAQPYNPDPSDLRKAGSSKLLEAPIATLNGEHGYFNGEFSAVAPILEHHVANSEVIVLGTHDYHNSAKTLREVVAFLKGKGARFTTLTMLAAERS